MQLPIGYDNFRAIVENKLDFVDKSLFIKEVLDDSTTQIAVITRPRRFGKTLNLSMLQHFLTTEAYGRSTEGLFQGLKILEAGQEYLEHHRKYPVIFVTFKGVKAESFDQAFRMLCHVIGDVYTEHRYLLNSEKLDDDQKKYMHRILTKEASQDDIASALKQLSHFLALHHGVNAWLLIDEYDTPIQKSYTQGYYDPMISLMRSMFGEVMKTNPYLHKAVVTGILRIARESLFSDLNNVNVYSLLCSEYGEHFGFTTEEVDVLFKQAGLEKKLRRVRYWYNGYRAGKITLYNPWSIVNCIQRKGEFAPYWINTSDNQLIQNLLIRSEENFQQQFEPLLQGDTIQQLIDEHMVFQNLQQSTAAVWSLLLMAGYLKVTKQKRTNQGLLCTLQAPNFEVRNLYRQIVEQWISQREGVLWYNHFLNDLLTGDLEEFERKLGMLMEQVVSHHDTANHPEAFYHGLMLGLTASLSQNKAYELQSNRESGKGRYDYLIFAKDPTKLSILLEFKKADKSKTEEELEANLEKAAQDALDQIERKNYAALAEQRGCTQSLKLGLAFSGKSFKLKSS